MVAVHKPCRVTPKPFVSMPPFPPGLGEWLAPGVFLAVLGLLLGLQGKRIDELRDDMKELRADLQVNETRQQQDMKELRAELKADNKVLSEKLDRLIETLLTAKPS